MRLRGLVGLELAKDGLKVPPGWTIRLTPTGTLCVHDPADDEGNPHGRIRAGIRIDGADMASDETLVRPMTVQARSALRRGRTIPERRRCDPANGSATGWCMLVHPLSAAILRGLGLPAERTPPQTMRPEAAAGLGLRSGITLSTARTQDLLSVSMDGALSNGETPIRCHLESKPGSTTLAVSLALPELAMTALTGQPLERLMDLRCGDGRVDAALAKVRIAKVEAGIGSVNPVLSSVEPHSIVTFDPAIWIPWDQPPPDVARLVELSPERH